MRLIQTTYVIAALAGLCAIFWSTEGVARDHYVAALSDPGTVNGRRDGSAQKPWSSSRAALASGEIQSGDRLLLLPGNHGYINILTDDFDPPVLLEPGPEGGVQVERITVDKGRGLTFRGLMVALTQPDLGGRNHIETAAKTARIRFEEMDIRGSLDAPERYLGWDKADWSEGPGRRNGVVLAGPDSALIDSRITGVNFALTVMYTGPRAEVRGNHVQGFAGDAYRGLSNDSVFAGNRAENCIKINDNHDDGFQSWAPRKKPEGEPREIRNVVVENNIFIEWTAKKHPLRCTLQGIVLFDGPYKNFIIRNNVVLISAYHGVAVYAGDGVQVLHNTVAHVDAMGGGHPWIMLSDNRGDAGTEARDNLVAGNIAHSFRQTTKQPQRMEARANAKVSFPARDFAGLRDGDMRPFDNSKLIDSAPPATAPPWDIDGTPRPQGAGPDFGAYEVR